MKKMNTLAISDQPSATRCKNKKWTFLILLFCFLAAGRQTWAEPISLKEYHHRVEGTIRFLESGKGKLEDSDIRALQRQFPVGLQVREAGGLPIPVDTKDLQAWFQRAGKSEKGRELALSRLKWLSRQVSANGSEIPLVGSKWGPSRKALDTIYRTEEFAHLAEKKPSVWRAFVDRYLKALSDWLRERLRNIAGIEGKWADYVIYAVYGLIFLGGCLVIFLILRSFGPVGWRFGRRKRPLPEPEDILPMDWTRWRDDARGHASRGAFRDAIRALFVSALMEGHQKGWWIYEPEATNREHLARVTGPNERRAALKSFMDLYEQSWYGLGKPGETDFQQGESYLQTIGSAV